MFDTIYQYSAKGVDWALDRAQEEEEATHTKRKQPSQKECPLCKQKAYNNTRTCRFCGHTFISKRKKQRCAKKLCTNGWNIDIDSFICITSEELLNEATNGDIFTLQT